MRLAWPAAFSPALAAGVADALFDAPGLTPEIVPVGEFYNISKNLFDPTLDARTWTLQIDGWVERELTFDYEGIQRLPATDEVVTLTCISNEVGGSLAGNAVWHGTPLGRLLQAAGVRPNTSTIRFEAADGYTESLPIEKAMHPATLLAWRMNGSPLTPKHGFPARLIVPGRYGVKNVKWLTRITAIDSDYAGYWPRRGWSHTAVIKTYSRIDIPARSVQLGSIPVIGGVAYAGERGVQAVELSIDDGYTWLPAHLKPPLGPYAWRLWAFPWHASVPGSLPVVVRATDGEGRVQTAEVAPPLPDGASGYHRRNIRVRRGWLF